MTGVKRPLFSRFNQWLVPVLFTVVAAAIIAASVQLINYLKKEEIKRIDLFVNAIKFQQDVAEPPQDVQNLLLKIYQSNNTIPTIILYKNGNGIYDYANISEEYDTDEKIVSLAKKMALNYAPIEIKVPDGNNQYVYYDNSNLLKNLQYAPYLLGCFILLYLLFTFWFMRTIKKTDEGYVWAGLAKETAHQIGTPLSSMIGWIEIMRMENPESMGITEIEKDVERLRTISERFSKIGSVPEIRDMNLTETVQMNYDYLKARISGKVAFTLSLPEQKILTPHNRILMSWVIENLVKNAVDAMKGQGSLQINVTEKNKNIIIDVKDTGVGMTARQASNVFKPGYSTKQRGWGLGLSLAKRVIKEYHRGDIRIAQTEPGKGSTFRIILKK